MAAVLACGTGAVLSHRSAAALWGLLPRRYESIEVIARGPRRRTGVRVHRSRMLTPADVTIHYGIPVTTPARTLLDLADQLNEAVVARAVNEAQVLRLASIGQLREQLARSPGRGAGGLRRLVSTPTAPTRSAFEDAFLGVAARHGLPCPQVNQVVAGHRVDMAWHAQHLVVELDGLRYHDGSQAFERDRERDADLLVAGYSVVRITGSASLSIQNARFGAYRACSLQTIGK